jgi:hypothetical protein
MLRWDSGREGRLTELCREGASEGAEEGGEVSGSSWEGNVGDMILLTDTEQQKTC